jgi:hypothetical protein
MAIPCDLPDISDPLARRTDGRPPLTRKQEARVEVPAPRLGTVLGFVRQKKAAGIVLRARSGADGGT